MGADGTSCGARTWACPLKSVSDSRLSLSWVPSAASTAKKVRFFGNVSFFEVHTLHSVVFVSIVDDDVCFTISASNLSGVNLP